MACEAICTLPNSPGESTEGSSGAVLFDCKGLGIHFFCGSMLLFGGGCEGWVALAGFTLCLFRVLGLGLSGFGVGSICRA